MCGTRRAPAVIEQIQRRRESNDALIRQAAVEALGRLGRAPDPALLGDPSKLVQRTAAWAIRQSHSRHEDSLPTEMYCGARVRRTIACAGAPPASSRSTSRRWRRRPELAAALERLTRRSRDDRSNERRERTVAVLVLDSGRPSKQDIEDTLLTALRSRNPPGCVRTCMTPSTTSPTRTFGICTTIGFRCSARPEDRDACHPRAAGRWRHGCAQVRARSSSAVRTMQKKELLQALTELPLRRADIYDLNADLEQLGPPVYNRIGNDIEQIAFFGESAERFAEALSTAARLPRRRVARACRARGAAGAATPIRERERSWRAARANT